MIKRYYHNVVLTNPDGTVQHAQMAVTKAVHDYITKLAEQQLGDNLPTIKIEHNQCHCHIIGPPVGKNCPVCGKGQFGCKTKVEKPKAYRDIDEPWEPQRID